MKIQQKVFVVTGAGGGIGGEVVRVLIERGAKVAAVDLRDESLAALSASINAAEGQLSTHAVNVAEREAVEQLPDQVIATHGAVDGVINCAGIIQPFVRTNDLDYEAIERVMNVNFYGTLSMTKSFLPHLLERPEAYIANVASMGGFLPVPGQGIYGASKAAVKLMTEALYAELLETPVHVSIIYPGATETDITKNSGVETPGQPQDGKKPKMQMLPARTAAEQMINGIEKNKPQILIGSDTKMMNKLYRLNPVFATKFIAKQMKSLLG